MIFFSARVSAFGSSLAPTSRAVSRIRFARSASDMMFFRFFAGMSVLSLSKAAPSMRRASRLQFIHNPRAQRPTVPSEEEYVIINRYRAVWSGDRYPMSRRPCSVRIFVKVGTLQGRRRSLRRLLSAGLHYRERNRATQYATSSSKERHLRRLGCLAISGTICQPLSDHAFECVFGAHRVVDAKSLAVVHPEIKLCQIAVQVLLRHVLISADQAPLKYREIAFRGVDVRAVNALELATVIDKPVALHRPRGPERCTKVRMQRAFPVHVGKQGLANFATHFALSAGNHTRPHATARARHVPQAKQTACFRSGVCGCAKSFWTA